MSNKLTPARCREEEKSLKKKALPQSSLCCSDHVLACSVAHSVQILPSSPTALQRAAHEAWFTHSFFISVHINCTMYSKGFTVIFPYIHGTLIIFILISKYNQYTLIIFILSITLLAPLFIFLAISLKMGFIITF
jgi:hypothetical protein